MKLAAIDLGTNSLTVTLLEETNGEICLIKEWVKIIRLGQGLKKGGFLHPDAKVRCLDALKFCCQKIDSHGVDEILAVGTAALRNAKDGKKFIKEIENQLGLSFIILSGEEEAELSFKAITHEFSHLGKSLFMIDIGGGSTELVEGDINNIKSRISLNVGTVSFSEKYFKNDPPTYKDLSSAKKELSKIILPLSSQPQNSVVIGVAGTVTTLKAVEMKMENYDHSFIHGKELTLNSIIKLGNLFLSMPNLKRAKLKGLPSERSDIIPMGVIILEAILRKINRQSIIISDHGLRWGLIYRWIDQNL